jgi:adenylate kinase family enzyme
MRRVAVVRNSGAGKNWLGSRLAAALGVPYVEFDAIHHGPGWQELPAEEMRRELDVLCPAGGEWVGDGNYTARGGDVVRSRADTIVWLGSPAARTSGASSPARRSDARSPHPPSPHQLSAWL